MLALVSLFAFAKRPSRNIRETSTCTRVESGEMFHGESTLFVASVLEVIKVDEHIQVWLSMEFLSMDLMLR